MISWNDKSDELLPLPSPKPMGETGTPRPQLQQHRTNDETIVVSPALSRPMVFPVQDASSSPPEPYRSALTAVYAHAGLTSEQDSPMEPVASPSVDNSLTPEAVVTFLSTLPGHLSQESRYARMEEELRNYPNQDSSELVGDAAARLVALRQELTRGSQNTTESVRSIQLRIELLEAELARMRTQLVEREQEEKHQRQDLLVQIDEMTGVIVFFDGYQSYLLRKEQEEQEAAHEPPTFPDDATMLRLLEYREAA